MLVGLGEILDGKKLKTEGPEGKRGKEKGREKRLKIASLGIKNSNIWVGRLGGDRKKNNYKSLNNFFHRTSLDLYKLHIWTKNGKMDMHTIAFHTMTHIVFTLTVCEGEPWNCQRLSRRSRNMPRHFK